MTIDGKTVVTHNETNPFVIDSVGFATFENQQAQFYYSCNHVSVFIQCNFFYFLLFTFS